ncbi:MAG TPA: hypothetical protein VHN79_08565 [Lacunisphaera sp.]|nr:hypothetical protein [Lacunisphaera sp.]
MPDQSTSEEPGAAKALDHIRSMLISGETLEAWAIQRRLFALFRRRTIIAATSGRFIGITRGILGGFDPVDIRWQDLKEAKIRVGIFSATISLAVYNSSDLALGSSGGQLLAFSGLRKHQAQDICRICQTHEQAWREKRRVRELEELRAKSGGVQISHGNTPAQGEFPVTGAADSAQRLQQAKQMLEAKLITDAEYEGIKARIINSV